MPKPLTFWLAMLLSVTFVGCSKPGSTPQPTTTSDRMAPVRTFGSGLFYSGQTSLEERIARSNVIARVSLRSVSQIAEPLTHWKGVTNTALYVGALEYKFSALEYLIGSGCEPRVLAWHPTFPSATTAAVMQTHQTRSQCRRCLPWSPRPR